MKSRGQNILMVAFHFPPIASAGTHRTLNFVRQLSARGHNVGVVTAASIAGHAEDPELLDRLPADVLVERAGHFDPFHVLMRMRYGLIGLGKTSGAAAQALLTKTSI